MTTRAAELCRLFMQESQGCVRATSDQNKFQICNTVYFYSLGDEKWKM